jgi:predicted DNA-binding ribbon-helix-helix protein
MKSTIGRNVKLGEIRTTVTLDPKFWRALDDIAAKNGEDPASLIERICRHAPKGRWAAALRIYVVEYLDKHSSGLTTTRHSPS